MASHDPLDVWRRSERSSVGPKPKHSRAAIVAAAIGIADKDGMAAVSIRRVAADIGAGAASLYRYLNSHDELIELMVDSVGGEYDLGPSAEPPRAQLLNLAWQGRAIMHRHPWLATLLLTRPAMGPNSIAYLERALAALETADMPGPAKLQTVAMLTAISSAFVQNELAQSAGTGANDDGAIERLQHLSAAVQSGKYPHLADALGGHLEQQGPGETFTGIIGNYLAGAGLPMSAGFD